MSLITVHRLAPKQGACSRFDLQLNFIADI
jgi:hypothetical protein